MIVQLPTPVTVEEITDPVQAAAARLFREQYARNAAWLQVHAGEIYTQHRGKHIAIAEQELFVGDSVEAVLAWVRTTHPDDQGRIIRYIPREKLAHVYAHSPSVTVLFCLLTQRHTYSINES